MPKTRSIYICQKCEQQSPQWLGQCPKCEEWNTFVETIAPSASSKLSKSKKNYINPVVLSDVVSTPPQRLLSGIGEFDRVLGGGLVPGQVILLAGDPGIGKSTLLTQIAKKLSGKKVLYVCGEESLEQIKIRATRLNYEANNLLMLPETDADVIAEVLKNTGSISLVIVDSIQTLTTVDLMGAAGSVGQVRGCTQKLATPAKAFSVPLILAGHVTKAGVISGPKVLEHLVDTVLYLEGDAQHMYRILKTVKNRFGAVSEVGIFEMGDSGLREVTNPSEMFLDERLKSTSGSCVTVVMEGFRPILFEIQALTTRTSFGYPRRTTSGFNANRLQVLIAILEKRLSLRLADYDVFVNVAGGFKVSEYACDLAVCFAIVSSLKDKPIAGNIAAFGECGLSGEIRKVSYQNKREQEAKKLGFTQVISPASVKSIWEAVKLIS